MSELADFVIGGTLTLCVIFSEPLLAWISETIRGRP